MPGSAPPDSIIAALLAVYEQAEYDLLTALARAVQRGAATDDLSAQAAEATRLREAAQRIAALLERAAARQIPATVENAAQWGDQQAVADLRALLGWDPRRAARPLNQVALEAIARSLADTLTPTHLAVTRTIADVYQRIVGMAVVGPTTGVDTVWEARQRALNEFAAAGVSGFVDRRGRSWQLSSYAEMAVRTATARAAVDAHMDRLGDEDVSLVYVSDSPEECSLCRPWEGKVLTRSGTDQGGRVSARNVLTNRTVQVQVAGSLTAARAAGLLHPNCTHSVSAYLPGATRLPTDTENPQGYKDRQELRRLERKVRAAKRRQAVAVDPESKRDATAAVRAAQARIREHVAATGQRRQPRREQLVVGDATQARPARELPPVELPPLREDEPTRRTRGPADLSDDELEAAMASAIADEEFDRFDELANESDRRDAARQDREARNARARQRREQRRQQELERQGELLDRLLSQGVDEEEAVAEAYGISVERQRRDRARAALLAAGYRGSFKDMSRAAYRDRLLEEFIAAEDGTNGFLLSREGERRGIDSRRLFTGNETYARRWASDELKEWWDQRGRLTYAAFVAELLGENGPARGGDFLQ